MKKQAQPEGLSPAGLAVPPPLQVEAPPNFQGSLVTLFHLARDGRIDLTGVPLAPVCSAYTEYLAEIGFEDVESAGAALLALAYLVERKAWALLPIADPPPPQEIPELPEPTAHEYAPAIDTLDRLQHERANLFFRAGGAGDEIVEAPIDLSNLTTRHLARALERLLEKAQTIDVEPLAKPRPSLGDVMKSVLRTMQSVGGRAGFSDLLPENYTRLDAVFVFLAVLELIRVGQIGAEVTEDDVCLRLKNQP